MKPKPAYPAHDHVWNTELKIWEAPPGVPTGLTDLELFAAMAMQGLCAADPCNSMTAERCARYAVEQAIALRAELDRVMEEGK